MTSGSTVERKSIPGPFQNSLSALAQVTLLAAGAEGYAFFRRRPYSPELTTQLAAGTPIDETLVLHTSGNVVTYPLGSDGLLAFIFRDEVRPQQSNRQLERMVAAIASVWTAARNTLRYSELASQVADLETRLLDSRISDRVRGYLATQTQAAAVDAIIRHVEGVLSPKPAERALEKLSQELEEEVEERRVTNRAKAILRSVHGMSEEEAHVHLRQTSRKTRRKIKDIAEELIRQYADGKVLQGQSC